MKRIFRTLIICLLLFTLFVSGPVLAKADNYIRVGLASGLISAEFQVVQGQYQLMDSATGLLIAVPQKGEKWTIVKEGLNLIVQREGLPLGNFYPGPLILKAVDEDETNIVRFRNGRYRDNLIFHNESQGILVVNSLSVEKYLYGVVGKEMGVSAPMEALKAQAVVSRTYALSLSHKNKSAKYDVGVDTSTQVYGGYDAETVSGWNRVKEAVDSTAGEVIYYDGQLIQAFFHSNAGGYTENSENVWVEALPYIKAVASPWDEFAVSYPSQTSSGWPANTYRWETVLTRQEIQDRVAAWNAKRGNKTPVGEITEIKISRKQQNGKGETLSGRVTLMELIGTQGTLSVVKDNIRSLLGLKSTLFDLELDSTVAVLDGNGILKTYHNTKGLQALGYKGYLSEINAGEKTYSIKGWKSNKVMPKIFEKVVIRGKGYGHGLGMSQWGAQGMAQAGYKYDDIIEHYYNQGKKDGRLTIKEYR